MWLNVFLFVIIIALNVYGATLSYSFYSTSKKNHFRFKHAYTSNVLLILQSILAIYFLISGNDRLNEARWMCFNLAELSMFYFVLRSYANRHFELIITSVFMVILMLSTLYLSLIFNLMIVAILIGLSLASRDNMLKRWFSVSFLLYSFTSIVPVVLGFTQTESILAGLVFTLHFTVGIRKLYMMQKTDEELKRLIQDGKL